jgi:hypothetical protein
MGHEEGEEVRRERGKGARWANKFQLWLGFPIGLRERRTKG